MKGSLSSALILLMAIATPCLAVTTKRSNKVIGNWKYSYSATENNVLAFNEFSLHDDKNAALGLNFVLSCGPVRTKFFITPVDEKAKITSPVVTGATGEKFTDWKPCPEVEGFECLGVEYQGSSEALYGYLREKGQLSFVLKADGQRATGEADLKVLDEFKQDITANCHH